ncbi:MAG: hypothetical protein IPH04_18865 [Saprospirales bacterium]|nr:hypothetical protein [Saprospirales bacterium]
MYSEPIDLFPAEISSTYEEVKIENAGKFYTDAQVDQIRNFAEINITDEDGKKLKSLAPLDDKIEANSEKKIISLVQQ